MAIVTVVGVGASGCSFSYSSKSLFESSHGSSESSESSSDSSGGGEAAETAYGRDVRDQTIAFVGSGESLEAFQASLGDVARRYGIIDWEASQATYVGIGQGLAAAKVRGEQLATFESELAGSDPGHRSALRQGYDSAGH
jgi:hypothetical protein